MTPVPLQVGSATARAVHDLLSGDQLVQLEPCRDPLTAACEIVQQLAARAMTLAIVFPADTIGLGDRLCSKLRRRTRRLPGLPEVKPTCLQPWLTPWTEEHSKVVNILSLEKPDDTASSDVLIIDADAAQLAQTIRRVGSARQILILSHVDIDVLHAARGILRADRLPYWHAEDLPLEVILAGAPQ